jgi:hypothetical protein
MKYLEQRVEELEREMLRLKAKIISLECKHDHLYNSNIEDTSKYLNNYPPYSGVNLMSEPDLETTFASPWDCSEAEKKSLDTITIKKSSAIDDSTYYHPEYPNVLGSWDPTPDYVDSTDIPTYYPPANPEDVLNENESGFKKGYNPEPIRPWKSDYDKMDKDFLEWLNIEKPFTVKSLFKDYKRSKNFVKRNA